MHSFSSENFLKLAENFSKSATILLKNIDKIRPMPYASVFFCLCHSLELSMKAFLIHEGKKENDLRKLGHNLSTILAESEKFGFIVSADYKAYIQMLSSYFKNHDFRYPNMKEMTLPDHTTAIRMAKNIIRLTRAMIEDMEAA